MTNAQHTPGPWVTTGHYIYPANDESAEHIADCTRADDARLIAAAPDMKIELEEYMAVCARYRNGACDDVELEGFHDEIMAIYEKSAAIAKAA